MELYREALNSIILTSMQALHYVKVKKWAKS